ncbi:WD repeat protein [Aspergillus heteromorphus CBS 117.55]|uniref:WD repeat protein n=1 Tax=Aspergillus heteromorphus CBS 117.55 TaxID=1448321 RepID=A0A317WYR6_9EURO|nr:WD repeat protein [Aspergillus heteromorphus CBS 117.55]PWY91101.1 WD repeat protein [Aspergillus heteromorphus CBS 117.55]
MSDYSRLPTRGSSSPAPPPPPPPVPVQQSHKYSNRAASALARFAQPFFSGSRPPSPHTPGSRADLSAGPRSTRSKSLPGESQTVSHKTGIPIAALDISPQRTHAVIGGKEILKTIRVSPDHSSEEFNLRNAIISYSSTHHVGSGLSARHKDQLTVRDVKWSHGGYDQIIATAVANGRIVVYDLLRTGLECCRFQGHSRQVHRLAFNPHHASWLLSGSQDSSIRMWDLRTASAERGVLVCGSLDLFHGNSDAIRDIRWSPTEGVMFATATDSGAIQLWDCRKSNAPLMRITAHDRPCFSVDWHPDGKHLVSGGTDRQVKVWDFSSSAERRQKPAFQFRTPQAVLNVRWRPPSWAREPEGAGDWQSSQVVTSYDKEDPRVHLWDLRRPHIPFREFDRYDAHATDLLWHSKDLLWTVGEAGAFTQTDIRYAPQVVNQRPTCSVAWSPSGEVLAFVQKRPRRSTLGLSATEFVGPQQEEHSSGEALSQSPGEDILDEPSFASIRHRHSKSTSARQSKSLGSTPPGAQDLIPVLPLEKVLSKIKTPDALQFGAVGSIPGATMDRDTSQYLASQYSALLPDSNTIHPDALSSLLESLDHNAQCSEDASLLKLAQTWRIIKFAVIQELEVRAREQRRSLEKGSRSMRKRPSKEGPIAEKQRTLEDGRNDKLKTRLFKGVMENEASKHPLADSESASNMTTPLAQPLPDSPLASLDSTNSQVTSLNDTTDIQPLPPSVLSSNHGTMTSNDWSSMSDIDPQPIHQFQHRQSNASEPANIPPESLMSDPGLAPMAEELEDDQRSAPRAIAGRADWHLKPLPGTSKGTSEVDEFDQKMEDKRAAIRDYKIFPKKVLSLETPMEPIKPPGFHRHESSESFPMFSASTESSHPPKSMATSFSSAAILHQAREREGDSHDSPEAGTAALSSSYVRTRGDSVIGSAIVNEKGIQDSETLSEEPPGAENVHLQRPSTPPRLFKESEPLDTPSQESEFQTPVHPSSTYTGIPGVTENLLDVGIPISSDVTTNKPWSIEWLFKEAIRHYHSGTQVDIQSAAHLLQKLHMLFQDCDKILPTPESEYIFKAYNEQLMRQSMYLEAAELRLQCVPSYPAVYEYAQGDTYMNVFCFTCKRPYENPMTDNRRCHRCDTPQEPCAICMSLDPPPEWVAEQSNSSPYATHEPDSEVTSHIQSSRSSLKTEPIPECELPQHHLDTITSDPSQPPRPKGSTLWTWCQGCGHGGHLACISIWLNDISVSEGGCATPGCMHDCGPGPRREHNRSILLEESKRRDSAGRKAGVGFVKRDTWTKGESRAVEKVRGMLGVGASAGSASTTTTTTTTNSAGLSGASSNTMSPKKVRLVTPSEQGQPRRGPRSSIGGLGGLSG